jgi:hypothetical protein
VAWNLHVGERVYRVAYIASVYSYRQFKQNITIAIFFIPVPFGAYILCPTNHVGAWSRIEILTILVDNSAKIRRIKVSPQRYLIQKLTWVLLVVYMWCQPSAAHGCDTFGLTHSHHRVNNSMQRSEKLHTSMPRTYHRESMKHCSIWGFLKNELILARKMCLPGHPMENEKGSKA